MPLSAPGDRRRRRCAAAARHRAHPVRGCRRSRRSTTPSRSARTRRWTRAPPAARSVRHRLLALQDEHGRGAGSSAASICSGRQHRRVRRAAAASTPTSSTPSIRSADRRHSSPGSGGSRRSSATSSRRSSIASPRPRSSAVDRAAPPARKRTRWRCCSRGAGREGSPINPSSSRPTCKRCRSSSRATGIYGDDQLAHVAPAAARAILHAAVERLPDLCGAAPADRVSPA